MRLVTERPPSPARDPGAFRDALSQPLELADGWRAWRVFCLRSTGFPLDWMERLEDPALERSVAASLEADAHLETALEDARTRCRAELRAGDEAVRKRWRRVLSRLDRGGVPHALAESPGAEEFVDALRVAYERVDETAGALASAFERGDAMLHERVRAVAREPRFREAVAWQNRGFYVNGLERYARGRREDSRARKRRTVIARYLQRYTTKNESIGFFGPFAWGRFDAGPAKLEAGPDLVARRDVRYEYWALDALLKQLFDDRALMLATSPCLSPAARLDGATLVLPGATIPLAPAQLAFIEACDGHTPAGELIVRFLHDPGAGLSTEDAFIDLLGQLVQAGALVWAPRLPATGNGERHVSTVIAAVGDAGSRETLDAGWRTLEHARGAVETAATSEATIAALLDFDRRFEAVTGRRPERHHGRMYAGRTPLYLDCVRDVEVRLPAAVTETLAAPLGVVLDSARWFGEQLMHQFSAYVNAELAQLPAHGGRIPLVELWQALQGQSDVLSALVGDVVEQTEEHWQEILAPDFSAQRVDVDIADVAQQARARFATPGAVWSDARFHSPDLMLAAPSARALEGDDWFAVLGELHALNNLLVREPLVSSAPDPGALMERAVLERPAEEIVPVRRRAGAGHRGTSDASQWNDYDVLYDDAVSEKPGDRVLRIADLYCERDAGSLRIRCLGSALDFDAKRFFGPQLRLLAISRFRLFAPRAHLPRVSIGRLVVQRESWELPLSDLAFADDGDRARRYLEARRWMSRTGLPRYAFYRLPREPKPMFVDFHSALFVDLLLDQVRACDAPDGRVTLSEMLPTPGQCWLTDAEGRRYTSELRMAVSDCHAHEENDGQT